MKVKTSVTVEKELIEWAKNNGVNMSFELRKALSDKRERMEKQ
jgi:post-segregation antitoxin (ccd killing protein)